MRKQNLILSSLFIALFVGLLPQLAAAMPRVRVPQDANLQQAFAQVQGGGVIEVSPGVYPAPPNSFRLTNFGKGFTVRAAAGAAPGSVVLDGQGARPILRFENSDRSRGRQIFFSGLTFRGGLSTQEGVGGAVTLSAAQASFTDCLFENNTVTGTSTGGGAVFIAKGSEALFFDSTFENNSSQLRGGGLEINNSQVYVHKGRFLANRVNLPGHRSDAHGGAMRILDSQVRIYDSHFEGNGAAWVGGAIYIFGIWGEDVRDPASDLLVANSTFLSNRIEQDLCCPPGPTGGAAIHAEDHTRALIFGSQFTDNRAAQGGALSVYRAEVEIEGSLFDANQAIDDTTGVPSGGALSVASADFADGSTDFGAINRPSASVTVSRSLFRGDLTATPDAANGGCVAAAGDLNRRYGDGGVAQDGTDGENRTKMVFEQTVFHGCDVAGFGGANAGFGGALSLRFVDLTMSDSMVLASHAREAGAVGGGLAVFEESSGRVVRTTFAGNSAEQSGGGFFWSGSNMEVSESFFIGNEVSPGVAEPIATSRGAGLLTTPRNPAALPGREADAAGVVRNCLFTGNIGVPVFEIDTEDKAINRVVYNNNQFHSTTFGDKVFVNIVFSRQGSTAPQLNSMVVQRSAAPSTKKSQAANSRLATPPRQGSLLAVPSVLSDFGEATSGRSYLAYAGSGGVLSLAGQNQAAPGGVIETGAAGAHTLRASGTQVATTTVGGEECSSEGVLCLRDGRFLLDIGWRDFVGNTGYGHTELLTTDTGYFWFFRDTNVELVVKALDGTVVNGRFWIFYGALSSVEYELRVLDTVSRRLKSFKNAPKSLTSIADTSAFPPEASKSLAGSSHPLLARLDEDNLLAARPAGISSDALKGGCIAGDTVLCLRGGRFQVEVDWRTPQGQTGVGMAELLTTDTGYFFFFNETNVELVLKILDGRAINDHFWVFYGALSNVEYTLRITDTETGNTKTFFNPQGNLASVADIEALPGQ